MRSFAPLILFLGIILTANLGFTSPVPDFIKNLKALISADNNDNIATRDVTNLVSDLAPNAEEDSTVEGWRRCPNRASCWKRSDDVDVVSESDMNVNHLAPSPSSNTLLERQLVDPMTAEMNKPCAKAILAKYDHINLTTMSDADKNALADAIIDCHYGPSKDISTSNLNAGGTTDLTTTKEAAKRCSIEQFENAYLATHWEVLHEPNKLYYWIILLDCLRQEPNSPIKPPKLRERQWTAFDPEQMTCIWNVQENFKGDRNKPEEVAVMDAEIDDKCGFKDKRGLGLVVPRDSADVDLANFKAEDCLQKVAREWGRPVNTEEEEDAFADAVWRCENP
ncbi:MAG: hypothetical protein Q9164_007340 [Protoblastenia rupestris]